MEKNIINYEIIDNNGVIHSSTDFEEMQIAFDVMVNPDSYDQQERDMWEIEWTGDLKFVSVLATTK